MKKAELIKNKTPKEPTMDLVVGNLFRVERIPVLELRWKCKRYYRGKEVEPELVRHFVWPDHWATLRDGRWTTEKLTFHYYNNGGVLDIEGKLKTKTLEDAIQSFLKEVGSQHNRIEYYEDDIVWKKRQAAEKRREERITQYAKEHTPPLPKGFTAWTKKMAAEKHISYVYLLQKTQTGIIDRRFTIHGNRGNIIEESSRGWSHTPGAGWSRWCYGIYWDRYGKDQKFIDRKQSARPVDRKGLLYPKNLLDINMISISATKALIAEAEKLEPINFGWLYERIQRDERAERIVKSGYKELIRLWRRNAIRLEQVKPRDGVHKMLGISKGRYRMLRNMNADLGTIEAARMTDEYFLPIYTDEEIKALNKVKSVSRKTQIAQIAKDTHLSLSHIIKLVGENEEADIRRYYDYLMMARRRGQNIEDEIVYRNKRWREFHDRWNAEDQKLKAKNRRTWANKTFRNIRREAKVNEEHFGWKTKGYFMTVAKCGGDIIDEGAVQHHCVGSSDTYLESMDKRKTFILFLRKTETPDEPYYTIEAKYDGEILQAYGAYDRKPDEEVVNKVLASWKKEIKKRIKEKAV